MDDAQEIDYGAITLLSRAVQLRDVVLDSVSFERLDSMPEGVLRLNYSHRAINLFYRLNPETARLDISIEYHLRGSRMAGDEQIDLFASTYRWSVHYVLTGAVNEVTDSVASDFSYANAQLNAYPYVRAFVTDLTARAGLPPLVLPVFRAPKRRPAEVVRGEIYRLPEST